jgi:mono/diheme cytochrome c family protein
MVTRGIQLSDGPILAQFSAGFRFIVRDAFREEDKMRRTTLEILGAAAVLIAFAGPATAQPSLERGSYLVNSIAACGNCHTPQGPEGPMAGMELSGMVVEDTPAMHAVAPNITPAGAVRDWSDTDLVKAIREGVRPDGTLIGPPMPFEVYRGLSDDDVASIVMYLRSVPAVENDPGASTYNIPLPPAWGPPVESVAAIPEDVTAEYGAYLAGPLGHCIVCHSAPGEAGPDLANGLGAGGMEFRGPWGTSVAANITPTGLEKYTDEQLAAMITTGKRPDGSQMLPPMPFGYYASMTPDDVSAIILYLRSLPPK